MDERHFPKLSPLSTGIGARCPRCGRGRLFAGFLTVAPACTVCGLDLSFAEQGDGPAVFITLLGGFVVLGLALWTEVRYEPPVWVHMAIFLPLALLVCVGMLRPLKGILVAQQYRTRAGEGQPE